MHSRAKVAGHAVHPMLMVFPLGLLAIAVGFDLLWLFTDRAEFALVAAYVMAAGLLLSPATTLTGWVDWSAIPKGTRAKRLGFWHGMGNHLVLALFAVSFLLRWVGDDDWRPSVPALICGFVGAAILVVTGWMGGELIERLHISVHPGGHPDAPSSLSTEAADQTAGASR
ncbi:MAG TPA: DUF2231 domain-containing protein [Cryptosporangiaceae bacterium]|nr:DUF2231 domain-containing protein [Cryptosporangiaceae bacterium]